MHVKVSRRGQVRRLLEQRVPPRVRLPIFRIAARLFPSQVGPQGFLRLASELAGAGRTTEAMACWRLVHQMAPADTRIAMQRVEYALDAGNLAEVECALELSSSSAGVPPRLLIRLAGQFAERGYMDSAGALLVRLADLSDAERLITQSPSIVSAGLPRDLHALGTDIASAEASADPRPLLMLARLCFAFRNSQVAAALYNKVASSKPLDALDRVAWLSALADADPGAFQCSVDELRNLLVELSTNAEATGTVAKVALLADELELSEQALLRALSALYGTTSDADAVSEDCLAMLRVLNALRDAGEALPEPLLERSQGEAAGITKVFLCGFGWSGSGALYDEIRGVEGFCEFEGAGCDGIINADADSEVTFVQGPGGLGELWKRAVEGGRIPWHLLWDTFSLHAAGLTAVGYAQYKSSAAARNHVRRYGAAYTGPFRRFLEAYASLRRNPMEGSLHRCLQETTESLCAMLVRQRGGRQVLFNNAVFGRDAVMLEIFRSPRAAIVYRDPRDVYVDRRENDRNHWRSPAQLAAFYARGLHRYLDYKRERGGNIPDLREVPFERFVRQGCFRARVRAWLIGELPDVPGTGHFDPEVSSRNIGIHVGRLTPAETDQLEAALKECRELDRLASAGWDAATPEN